MAHLTPDQFSAKWIPLLANNVFQDIDGVRLALLITDLKDSFAASTATANVPDWLKGTYYPLDYVILHPFATGPALFMKALAAGYLPVPSDPAGDASWAPALSPAADNALYQVGTVPALRATQGDWAPGRLYVLVNRLDAQGDPLPDVCVRALSVDELEPEGYALIGLGFPPERVSYDLASDTTTPAKVDAYTKTDADAHFGDLQTQQQHAYRIGVLENVQDARIVVKTPDGYVNVWYTMPTFMDIGSVVTVYGALSFPTLDYQFPAAGTLVLAAGSTLTLKNLRAPAGSWQLSGTGTLNSPVNLCPSARNVVIQDVTVNGYVYAFSYNLAAGATRRLRLQNVRLTNTDASQAALTCEYGYAQNYHTYIQAEVLGNTIVTAGDVVRFFDQFASYAAGDATAKSTNSLLLLQNTLRVGANKQVLNDTDGALGFTRGGNLYLAAPVPAQAYATVVGLDGGAAGGLAPATTTTLGGVMVGAGLQVDGTGLVRLRIDSNTLGLLPDGSLYVLTNPGNVSVAAQPQNVVAEASTSTRITSLRWDSVSDAYLYQIFRSVNGSPFTQIGIVPYPSLQDTQDSIGQYVRYYVVSANSAGQSPPSATVVASSVA